MTGQPPTITDIDVEQYKNPEFGLSTYDSYADGGGVCFTSYRRPVLNMRPKYRTSGMGITWQFPADLSIIGWLEHHYKGEYEILTDEDVHLYSRYEEMTFLFQDHGPIYKIGFRVNF